MSDYEFAMELRRGLLQIATALAKKWGCWWLRMVLTGEDVRRCQEKTPEPALNQTK
jgi:hypothetical protein